MGLQFTHVEHSQRVAFGSGCAATNLATEVDRLGAQRVMVIASARAARIATGVADRIKVRTLCTDVAPHVPIEKVELAAAAAQSNSIDLMISVGGGSTTGLAKAVALQSGIPIVAVPTTYAGSEVTDVWGITKAARKTTGRDGVVLPRSVIYDAELTLSMTTPVSIASGFNALAHCVDSMWAPSTDPVNQAFATEGIRLLARGLRNIADDPQNLAAREHTLCGAYMAAKAFASAGSGLHHKICHVLGGAYNLPHAVTHAAVLPHVLAYNSGATPSAQERMAEAFGSSDAITGLMDLAASVSAPTALRDYGFDRADIRTAAALILPEVPASNPRSVTLDDLESLLLAASCGTAPTPTP